MSDGFAALRHPGVKAFAVGRFFSAVATTAISVAVGWQLYQDTNSPLSLGLTGLVEVVPVILLSVFAGSVADRFPKRVIAMLAHSALAILTLILAAISYLKASPIFYYAVLAFVGAAMAFRNPAVGPLLPQLVPAKDFANANGWFSSMYEIASMVGPAATGLLITLLAGTTGAFLFAAGCHVVFVVVLARLPLRSQSVTRGQNWSDRLKGFRFVLRVKVFLAAITLDLFGVLFGGAVALLPIFARDILQTGANGLAWLRVAPALGALGMALIQTRLRPWKKPGLTLICVVIGFGLATIGFGMSRIYWLSFLFLLLAGVFDNVSVVIRGTLEQSLTPDVLRGRVSAVHAIFIGLSNELGGFESGVTAELFGPVYSVVGGGIGTLLVVAVVLLSFPALLRLKPLNELTPEPEKEQQHN
jgi:MFS family permease